MDGEIISVRCNKKYMNTIIYKIFCKDENIKDVYVGMTTNFESRKFYHERDSETKLLKLYQFIRNNGGWSNWDMTILSEYTCTNYIHASKLEWIWWKRLKASLNSVQPGNSHIRKCMRSSGNKFEESSRKLSLIN
jgi:hypothetical protein